MTSFRVYPYAVHREDSVSLMLPFHIFILFEELRTGRFLSDTTALVMFFFFIFEASKKA